MGKEPMMNGSVLTSVGSLLIFGWGFSHLFPTRTVVSGFGDISADNKRIITMEWLTEGVALMFIGILNALATYLDRTSTVTYAVYWVSFVVLNALSAISLFTGFRIPFIAYKLCPFLFTGSALLIVAGSLLN